MCLLLNEKEWDKVLSDCPTNTIGASTCDNRIIIKGPI